MINPNAKAYAAIIFYTDAAGNEREQFAVAVSLSPEGAARALYAEFLKHPDCAEIIGVAVDPEPGPADTVAAVVAEVNAANARALDARGVAGLTAPTVPASRTIH